jgi:hypothetical protein
MSSVERCTAIVILGIVAGCGGTNGVHGSGGGAGSPGSYCTPSQACPTGNKSYLSCSGVGSTDCKYELSDGTTVACAAHCDCTQAAMQVVAWCGDHGGAAGGAGGSGGSPDAPPIGSCVNVDCGDGVTRQICHTSDGSCRGSQVPASTLVFMPPFDCARFDEVRGAICLGVQPTPPAQQLSCLELMACNGVGCTTSNLGMCNPQCNQLGSQAARSTYAAIAICGSNTCSAANRCTTGFPQDAPGAPAGDCLKCREAVGKPASACVGDSDPQCGACASQAAACLSS